jgi:serine/threonine protein kinase
MASRTSPRRDPLDQDEQLLKTLEHDESYQVVRVLSKSERGSTELVLQNGLNRLLVRKRMRRELASVEAWERIPTIQSPCLPKIYDTYALPDQLVVVRDYVAGSSVRDEVTRKGAMSPARACEIARDVCHAAAALHAVGVIHRDITPGNVICSSQGAVLIDLGIARTHAENAMNDTTRLGTWGFAAPEQFGFAQTDARSDVYSIGRLLGYMLTAVTPASDEYRSALGSDDVPAELRRIVQKACSFEPSSRYASANELMTALTAALLCLEPAGSPMRQQEPSNERHQSAFQRRVELPMPSAFIKALEKASLPRRVASIAVLALSVLLSALFVIAGVVTFGDALRGEYEVEPMLMMFVTSVAIAILCWACACALVRAGGYAQSGAAAKLFVTAIRIVILYLCAWIAAAVISGVRGVLVI